MMAEIRCKYCDGVDVTRAGVRKTRSGTRQLYLCKRCLRRFSNANKLDKHTSGEAILTATTLYCQGYSYAEVAFVLRRRFRLERSRATLCRWVAELAPPYLEVRQRLPAEARPVRSALFTHRGLNYLYQIHVPKMAFAARHGGLVEYLTSLPQRLDHSIFEGASHCSHARLVANPGLDRRRMTMVNRLCAQAQAMARSNHHRHQAVEDYFLSCDRNTIAVEVPVYLYDKRLGTVAGHVDILQVNRGRIWVMDYKPGAARENPGQVVSQLTLYANALALRASTPVGGMICAYFDDRDLYSFRPERLDRLRLTTEAGNRTQGAGLEIYPCERSPGGAAGRRTAATRSHPG